MTLRHLLDRIGWSERQLASKLAASPNTVNDWCNRRRPVPRAVTAWLVEMADHIERHPPPEWRRPPSLDAQPARFAETP